MSNIKKSKYKVKEMKQINYTENQEGRKDFPYHTEM